MLEKCIKLFKEENYLVIDLECAPASSKCFWRKLGFSAYSTIKENRNFRMYKSLIETLKPTNKESNPNKPLIKLWKGSPIEIDKKESTWQWNISFKPKSNELAIPIIFPSHFDWKIEYSDCNKTKLGNQVRYFGDTNIFFENFIIIEKIQTKDKSPISRH